MKALILGLISSLIFSCNNNPCENERFHCRDEKIIDEGRGIKHIRIYYNNELLEEYFSTPYAEKDSLYIDYFKGKRVYLKELKNGKANGSVMSFFDNGDTSYVMHYRNDTLEGRTYEYYPDGKMKDDYNYKNGLLDGQYRSYYIDGHDKEKGIYKNGHLIKEHMLYYPDGNIKAVHHFDSLGNQVSSEHFR